MTGPSQRLIYCAIHSNRLHPLPFFLSPDEEGRHGSKAEKEEL